jgi:hypothetical protein
LQKKNKVKYFALFDVDFYFTLNSTKSAMLKITSANSSEMAFTIFRWELQSERTFAAPFL